jgi:hypothetical protein
MLLLQRTPFFSSLPHHQDSILSHTTKHQSRTAPSLGGKERQNCPRHPRGPPSVAPSTRGSKSPRAGTPLRDSSSRARGLHVRALVGLRAILLHARAVSFRAGHLLPRGPSPRTRVFPAPIVFTRVIIPTRVPSSPASAGHCPSTPVHDGVPAV